MPKKRHPQSTPPPGLPFDQLEREIARLLERRPDFPARPPAASEQMPVPKHEPAQSPPPAQSPAATAPPASTGPSPYWLPAGEAYDQLSEGTKWAVREILTPAYRRLVLETSDDLERGTALSLVHLIWLEICDQTRLAAAVSNPDPMMAVIDDPATKVAQHINLVEAKSNVAQLLARLRVIRKLLNEDNRRLISAVLPSLDALAGPPQPLSPSLARFCDEPRATAAAPTQSTPPPS